ncbi:hypothetical protein [Sphaerisporangium sp. TRM90804]|uniref:hypothetical protein n=1 Tax=Sphaerisporangium sp. TRM90804 TaxID=3031113 RepID=UPI0024483EC7|nr:hypothetical protein [Sphaerisporangium sp. TRM90804]MDH2424859.1 hypothetical protein [Sphaerisporangium sp. TRM90804]
MSRAVGLTAEELRDAGRHDAADQLQDLINQTPPGGFRTQARFPALITDAQPATETATEAPVGAKSPAWFTSEANRRGLNIDLLTVDQLRSLAAHFGYTLGELLLNAGLATESELKIGERPASQSRALAEFDAAIKEIVSSPLLSKRDREAVQKSADKTRQEIVETYLGGQ